MCRAREPLLVMSWWYLHPEGDCLVTSSPGTHKAALLVTPVMQIKPDPELPEAEPTTAPPTLAPRTPVVEIQAQSVVQCGWGENGMEATFITQGALSQIRQDLLWGSPIKIRGLLSPGP